MEREALKLALEALEGLFGTTEQFESGGVAVWRLGGSAQPKQAITAIKEALAQPAQEPYGYDWSMLEAAQESLREHMAMIHELEAALAQQAQEPVACVGPWDGPTLTLLPRSIHQTFEHNQPLYAAPPQRKWVGLTEEETSGFTQHEMTVVKYVSKVLQEKNT